MPPVTFSPLPPDVKSPPQLRRASSNGTTRPSSNSPRSVSLPDSAFEQTADVTKHVSQQGKAERYQAVHLHLVFLLYLFCSYRGRGVRQEQSSLEEKNNQE